MKYHRWHYQLPAVEEKNIGSWCKSIGCCLLRQKSCGVKTLFVEVDEASADVHQRGDDQQFDSHLNRHLRSKQPHGNQPKQKLTKISFLLQAHHLFPHTTKIFLRRSNASKMENIEQEKIFIAGRSNTEKEFRPTGAIAFFVVLILLSLATWFGIYLLMLQRV